MKGFLRFWYDFVIGDDWTIAAAVALALAVTALVAHQATRSAWWLLPALVAVGVTASLVRATRPPGRPRSPGAP